MVAKLLGYKPGVSKSNRPYMMAFVSSPYNPRECSEGAVGEKVETVFIPEGAQSKIMPPDVGHEIDLVFEISGGKAYLQDCTPERLYPKS